MLICCCFFGTFLVARLSYFLDNVSRHASMISWCGACLCMRVPVEEDFRSPKLIVSYPHTQICQWTRASIKNPVKVPIPVVKIEPPPFLETCSS